MDDTLRPSMAWLRPCTLGLVDLSHCLPAPGLFILGGGEGGLICPELQQTLIAPKRCSLLFYRRACEGFSILNRYVQIFEGTDFPILFRLVQILGWADFSFLYRFVQILGWADFLFLYRFVQILGWVDFSF